MGDAVVWWRVYMLWPAPQVTARRVILAAATVLSLATLGTSSPLSLRLPVPPSIHTTTLTANPPPTRSTRRSRHLRRVQPQPRVRAGRRGPRAPLLGRRVWRGGCSDVARCKRDRDVLHGVSGVVSRVFLLCSGVRVRVCVGPEPVRTGNSNRRRTARMLGK